VGQSPHILRSIARDSSLALILVGLAGPLWYLSTLVMARYYGAQVMGTFFIAWNLVRIISAVSQLGLDIGLLRFSAVLKAKGQAGGIKPLLWPAIGVITLVSTAAAAGLYYWRDWLALHFNAPYLPVVILFLAPSLPILAATSGFRETVRALGGIKSAVFQKNALVHLAFIAFLLILAYVGRDFFSRFGALGCAAFLSCVLNLGFLVFVLRYQTRGENAGAGQSSFRELFWYSLPLCLSSLLPAFAFIDRLILGYFAPPQEVAYYEVAAKMEMIITLPLLAVNSVIPPLVAQFYEYGNIANLEIIAQTTARWAYYMALPLTLLIILLAPQILGTFGADFTKARFALIVLSLAQLVNVASGSVAFILIMTGHQWKVASLRFITMAIAIALMIVLAKFYGFNGLACASALGIIGLNVFLGLAVWRYINIKAFARGVGWANISALLGVLVFFLSKPMIGPFGGAGLFLLTYLALVAKHIKQEIKMSYSSILGK